MSFQSSAVPLWISARACKVYPAFASSPFPLVMFNRYKDFHGFAVAMCFSSTVRFPSPFVEIRRVAFDAFFCNLKSQRFWKSFFVPSSAIAKPEIEGMLRDVTVPSSRRSVTKDTFTASDVVKFEPTAGVMARFSTPSTLPVRSTLPSSLESAVVVVTASAASIFLLIEKTTSCPARACSMPSVELSAAESDKAGRSELADK
mmetsp:Transcript_35794/g.93305  ORF Transcript_35794/g.93305 Transcript_35794/m.93305 type:complete len:202 (-) Transcript_35794:338-943(-)